MTKKKETTKGQIIHNHKEKNKHLATILNQKLEFI